ncbi:MAG: hypothetical protein EAZ92_10105 [Candidatus Kapaibacterium sp.]|nr:MAG: hypothetical protein EAZ92_10105 [Candidatus Kapabacteria bacterium]
MFIPPSDANPLQYMMWFLRNEHSALQNTHLRKSYEIKNPLYSNRAVQGIFVSQGFSNNRVYSE